MRLACLFCVWLIVFLVSLPAQESEVAAVKLKSLNDHFPFVVPETPAAWQQRSESLRQRVLVATGLWPMLEKTPLKPVIHGTVRRDGFLVQRVYFESLPGHFVTGMLFRPSQDNPLGLVDGKRPGVLSPHGHGGRLMRYDDDEIRALIAAGAEKYEQSGRYAKLARCVHLARMGCVTFIFDMLGYADSQQIDRQTAHRHATARAEEADRQRPIFYGIDADLNLQSMMGLQTWNAIRSLDFLASLEDVDADRLGVTGGSGGGTQTILLGAIDPRVKVGFPNGMVSTAMQGGCYCENCNYLRIGTGNVELAALFAPRPQGMTAADDWTKDMMTDGFPELQKLYAMLGQADNVMCRPLLHFPHNYNYVSRATMYPWMAKHLDLPEDTPLVEQDYDLLNESEMAVWNDQHPAPTQTGVDHERQVIQWWTKQNATALARSGDDVLRAAWRVMLSDGQAEGALSADDRSPDWLTVTQTDDALVFESADLGVASSQQPLVDDDRNYSGFTYTYNPPLVARRASQLARIVRAADHDGPILLRGNGPAAAWVAGAVLLLDDQDMPSELSAKIRCQVDPDGFQFADVTGYADAMFLPGSVKYGDMDGLIGLIQD